MISFVKLSTCAALVFVVAACTVTTTTTNTNTGDGGTPVADAASGTDSTTPDAGTASDSAVATDGEAGACTLSGQLANATCTTCVQGSCCAVFNACQTDQACQALNTCVVNCQNGQDADGGTFDAGGDGGSDACQQACGTNASQATIGKYNDQTSCLQTSCSTACQ